MYKIKNLKLKNPYFLAPMQEVNDIAFRTLCKKAGASLTFTGMINPLTKQKLDLDDKPAIQLFSENGKGIKEFIKKHDKNASLWDFNLGCPADTAKKHKFGFFMNDKLDLIEKILKDMRKSTNKPITIKLRISNNTLRIIKIAEKYCDAISIHPRTQAQGYSGIPNLEYAIKIKKSTPLPVIYSGNVNEKNAKKLLETFDFVMLGRESIDNPGIFAKLCNKNDKQMAKSDFHTYLSLALKYNLRFEQIKTQAINFTKGMHNAKKLREKLVKVKTIQEIEKIYSLRVP
jgi:tRNA-dihydrouridine synthase B